MKFFRNQGGFRRTAAELKTAEVRMNPGRIYGRITAGNSSRIKGFRRTVAVLKTAEVRMNPGRIYGRITAGNSSRIKGFRRTVAVLN